MSKHREVDPAGNKRCQGCRKFVCCCGGGRQPMEAAPQDGTPVLVDFGGAVEVARYGYPAIRGSKSLGPGEWFAVTRINRRDTNGVQPRGWWPMPVADE